MRRFMQFDCEGDALTATLDEASGTTGLLIVSGGNEIRSGAHGGMAALAEHCAKEGHPVFRYDRRGIGDSEGTNSEFLGSALDIQAAAEAFRAACPQLKNIVGFGNCDSSTSLALFAPEAGLNKLVLANPWTIEPSDDDNDMPPPAAIRARYLERLKNPRSLIDLFTGKINIGKILGGLRQATKNDTPSGLAEKLAAVLNPTEIPTTLLIAKRDSTAMAFMAAYNSNIFAGARGNSQVSLQEIDSSSHSFADAASKTWLKAQLIAALKA